MTKKILNVPRLSIFITTMILVLPGCKDAKKEQNKNGISDSNKSSSGSSHVPNTNPKDRETVNKATKQVDDQEHGQAPRPGGLLSSYKTGGIELMQQQIETMGPGLNRRKAIESLLIDASNLRNALTESDFTEIIKFIDQLPYAEDKGGFTGPFLGNIIGAQSSESVVKLVNSIDSKGLKGSLALALGKAQANTEKSDVKAISNALRDLPKTTFLCAWADQIESKVSPSDFDGLLRKIGLGTQEENVVIGAYVTSLTSKSGAELVQESKILQNPGLAEQMLIAGYKRWLREDSMNASADFAQVSNAMSPSVHDEIVEALVMQMQTQGDLDSAKQWSESIKNDAIKIRLNQFLKQMENNVKRD